MRSYFMGDFEVFLAVISVSLLAVIVYNVITILSFKDLLRRFGFMRASRRDFYECGFRPNTQRPVKISLQFLLICVFFLLYDIELVFLFPFVSGVTFTGFYDILLLLLFLFATAVPLFFNSDFSFTSRLSVITFAASFRSSSILFAGYPKFLLPGLLSLLTFYHQK